MYMYIDMPHYRYIHPYDIPTSSKIFYSKVRKQLVRTGYCCYRLALGAKKPENPDCAQVQTWCRLTPVNI